VKRCSIIYLVSSMLLFSVQSFSTEKTADKKKTKKNKNKFAKFVKTELSRLNSKTIIQGNKRIVTMDVNNDEKIDVELVYINDVLFKEKADFNYDGKFDKTDWYFVKGDIIQTTTIDSNYDGKVDIKIVKSYKDAIAGHIKSTEFTDKDFDGKFDTKKTRQFSEFQTMNQSDESLYTLPSQRINCAVDDYQKVHLPAIINASDETMVEQLEWAVNKKWEPYFNNFDNEEYNFQIQVQKSCQQEGTPENQQLFADSNIQESLKLGVSCMGRLNNTAINPQSSINFRKVIAGLTGYDHNGVRSRRHNNPLRLVCKLEDPQPGFWDPEGSTVYAMATISNTISDNNKITRVGQNPPLVVFRPDLAASLNGKKQDYPNQYLREKFHKLVFHEFIHTSLGTTHAENENSHDVSNVDYAQACGDYCFRGPGQNTELTGLSRRICSGEFTMERATSDSSNRTEYIRIMRRIKQLKK
jgi:hypothetical protein